MTSIVEISCNQVDYKHSVSLIKMKEAAQKYICKICNEETVDKKELLEGMCATWKLIKAKISYMKDKVKGLNKFQCHQEIQSLKRK